MPDFPFYSAEVRLTIEGGPEPDYAWLLLMGAGLAAAAIAAKKKKSEKKKAE